jgi:hypothetical protein
MTEDMIHAIDISAAKLLVTQKKNREDSIAHATTLPVPEIPKLVKGNWRLVRDAFVEMLSRQRGSNGIPLSYIVRPCRLSQINPTRSYNDDNWNTLNQKLVACAAHEGAKYEQDTNDVFSLIATHFDATEADSTIKKFKSTRNGKECWQALKNHFESTSSNIMVFEASEHCRVKYFLQ